ncbi:MAG: fatty acid desaturase [Cyanobacteriota bacterium]|nr:fatty acid desaturase [Cyanobacteriota bacterium]
MDLITRIIASLKTYIRGIALPGEEPLWIVTPMMVVTASAVGLVCDLAAAQLIWSSQRAWLYSLFVPLFALGQSALWYLYMVGHHAVHRAVSKRRWVNSFIAETTSIVCLAHPPSFYRQRHLVEHHHPKRLATILDPDYRWLKRLGFSQGQQLEQYELLLCRIIFSPTFYLKTLISRVRGHLIQDPLAQRAALIIWWAILMATAATFHLWAALVMYALLVIVAFPFSALLQSATEHVWTSKEQPQLKTHPRLLPIDANPHLFLVYLYWRMAVLTTDLCQHQIHHSNKPINKFSWPMAAYSADARADLPRAVWGIRNHFRASFAILAKAPPAN